MIIENDMQIKESNMSIEEIAYEAYVLNWLQENVDRKMLEETYSNYQNYIFTHHDIIDFEEYVEQYGYCGRTDFCYSDYNSFLKNEYKDEALMKKILSPETIIVYQHDLKMKETVEKLDIDFTEER